MEDQWKMLFWMAKEQSMCGIIFAAIEKLPEDELPPLRIKMMYHAPAEFIKKQNIEMNEQCEKVTEYFRKEGFRTCIMKGQGNARLYGDLADYRSSGDIDLWVEGGFRKVNGFVQKICPTRKVNELEIQFEAFKNVEVEVHYRPFIMRNFFYNRRLQKFFNSEAEACFGSEGIVHWTTSRFNLVHQLAHIRLHLFTEGIGLRQMMDYYFVLLNAKEDRTEIMRIVKSLGMETFAGAMMWIMHSVFGLEQQFLLCNPNKKDGKFLLEEIMKSGNFGRFNREQNKRKSGKMGHLWLFAFRNLRYWRFDKWDWICGPLWRVYYMFWEKKHGFK